MKHHRREGVDLGEMNDSSRLGYTAGLQSIVLDGLIVQQEHHASNEVRRRLRWVGRENLPAQERVYDLGEPSIHLLRSL